MCKVKTKCKSSSNLIQLSYAMGIFLWEISRRIQIISTLVVLYSWIYWISLNLPILALFVINYASTLNAYSILLISKKMQIFAKVDIMNTFFFFPFQWIKVNDNNHVICQRCILFTLMARIHLFIQILLFSIIFPSGGYYKYMDFPDNWRFIRPMTKTKNPETKFIRERVSKECHGD